MSSKSIEPEPECDLVLIDIEEAARRMSTNPAAVRRAIWHGELKVIRNLGARTLISLEAIREFIAQSEKYNPQRSGNWSRKQKLPDEDD